MQLLGKSYIHAFKSKHSTSRKSLDRWIRIIEGASFSTPHEVKQLFGSNVDFVGNQTVFDVGGNKIRTITLIEYGAKIVLVTHVLTHSEYDKNKWRVVK